MDTPSRAIALAVTAALGQGCFWMNCGDTSFSKRSIEEDLVLTRDGGLVSSWYKIDALEDNVCVRACKTLTSPGYYIDRVHSCELWVTIGEGEPIPAEELDPALFVETTSSTTSMTETGDTGLDPSVLGSAELLCVASGNDECVGGRHCGTLTQRASGRGVDALSAWLAREASAEAGSVIAFERLAQELRHHGAPADLVARAEQARADEIRHAAAVGSLAAARGGAPEPVVEHDQPLRALLEIAMENAVEGCVHETYAAARARYQATQATAPELRRLNAELADDEARHAELAAAIHSWVLTRLPSAEAEQVESARQQAWRDLSTAPVPLPVAASRELGLPDAEAKAQLVATLREQLAA